MEAQIRNPDVGRSLVFAVDFTERCIQGLEYLINVWLQPKDTLTLLHILDYSAPVSPRTVLNGPANAQFVASNVHTLMGDQRKSMEQQARGALLTLMNRCLSSVPTLAVHIVIISISDSAYIAENIVAYVNKQKPDTLYLCPRNLSAFDRLFHRSISEYCVDKSSVPVLVIQHTKSEQAEKETLSLIPMQRERTCCTRD